MPTIGEMVKDIRGARIREKEKLDKLVVTLSAGTFVLSVTFITGILDIGLSNTWVLFASWALLLLSIFLVLIALIIVDWHFSRQEDDLFNRRTYEGDWGRLADVLTIVSVAALITGIIFLAVFATLNIQELQKGALDTNSTQTDPSAFVTPELRP